MKLASKALIAGLILTAIDWTLTTSIPALSFVGPLAVVHKWLFIAMIWIGMNPHSPIPQYGLLARLTLLAFFTITSFVVIIIFKRLQTLRAPNLPR